MVQWLRLHTSTEGAQVEHLVSELKSHLPCAVAKNFKTNKLQKKKTNKQTNKASGGDGIPVELF